MQDKCYLCGSENDLTRDHVPPKNLFRGPLPSNLITAACCRTCNVSFSKMEEQLRIFVSAAINRSADGEWIWKNKVLESTFRRSPALKSQLGKDLLIGNVKLLAGNIELPMLTMDAELVNKCLIKITRGLMTHFYPNLDHAALEFAAFELNQFRVTPDWIRSLGVPYIYEERGNGQFRFLRALVDDDNRCGHWIYIFYDSISFVVHHDVRGNLMRPAHDVCQPVQTD